MKTTVISYSFTGNNDSLAKAIAAELEAEHIKVSEPKKRTMFKIALDILFNRTPSVSPKPEDVLNSDLIILIGPVWMGQVATPLRSYLKQLKSKTCKYAYVSISGGAEGGNINLKSDLNKRVGRSPAVLIDMHIADLLPKNPKPTKNDTMNYHLKESDIKSLKDTTIKALKESTVI